MGKEKKTGKTERKGRMSQEKERDEKRRRRKKTECTSQRKIRGKQKKDQL